MQGEGEERQDLPLDSSFHKWNSQGWARAMSGGWNSIWVCYVGQGPKSLRHHLLPSRCIGKVLNQKCYIRNGTAGTQTSTHVICWRQSEVIHNTTTPAQPLPLQDIFKFSSFPFLLERTYLSYRIVIRFYIKK